MLLKKEGILLHSKTVFITGGISGIGKFAAQRFAQKGYNVIVNYRSSQDKADELMTQLQNNYQIKCKVLKGDVGSLEDCQKMFNEINSFSGGADILIHNAGPYVKDRKPASDYEFDEWNYIINGNLNGVFYLTKLALPYMRNQKWGRIITFGFDRAETAPGWLHRSAFAAAKTGLVSLTKTLSLEEAQNGITVNMICPGDITNEWKEKSIKDAYNVHDVLTPVGRPGTGEDIARLLLFLCEEESSFITGSIIPVTGGKDVLGKYRN